jgi:phosphoglycolate phosphatase
VRPEAVIFDLDGTLIHSASDIHAALNTVLARHSYPNLELDDVKLMIGGGPELLIRRALASLEVQAASGEIDSLTAEFEQAYLDRGSRLTTLAPGARELLEYLVAQEISVGVCSNKPQHLCQTSLENLEVRSLVDVVRGSGPCFPIKPHPAVLLATIDELDTTAEQVLYVGDSSTDVSTGRSAAVDVALVRSGYDATPADSLGADWVVDDLRDIPAIWNQV